MSGGIGLQLAQIWLTDSLAQEYKLKLLGSAHDQGSFKNVKEEGVWVGYNKYRTVDKEWTGTYKNGVKIND